MTEIRHCSYQVQSGGSRYTCQNPAKVERDGKDFCTIHDTEYVKARRAKQQAKYEAKYEVDKARWDWKAARDKAVAGLTLEELQRVTPEMIRQVILAKTLGGEA